MRKILFIEDGAIAVKNGVIADIGKTEELKYKYSDAEEIINAEGRAALPGFVDPHTHAVFAGTRENEFSMRMEGKSYMAILRQSGGILNTVESVRAVSVCNLADNLKKAIRTILQMGNHHYRSKEWLWFEF